MFVFCALRVLLIQRKSNPLPPPQKNYVVRTDNVLGKDNIKLDCIIQKARWSKFCNFHYLTLAQSKALKLHILPNIIGIIAVMKHAEW